jgi:hypothetical protein
VGKVTLFAAEHVETGGCRSHYTLVREGDAFSGTCTVTGLRPATRSTRSPGGEPGSERQTPRCQGKA